MVALAIAPHDAAGDALPGARPIPRFQAVPLPGDQVSFRRDGRELTRFHHAPDLDRPFFYPLRASTESSLTRIGHPHDPVGHSHHDSVWFSHHDIEGTNFWSDGIRGGTGQVVCDAVDAFSDSDESCSATALIRWVVRESGETLLHESRTATVRVAPGDGDGWVLVLDSTFTIPDAREGTTLRETPFGLVGVRMAKTIGVHDGGGRILNSEGALNEDGVFRKPARWVDYSGAIEPGRTGGITLMDAPTNPGHPHPFHVRDDGWMGVCLTLEKAVTVAKENPLALRYALWVHDGVPDAAQIEEVWKETGR
ncbi:hypothetical protein BH23VER1_BH23VER1_04880 [soil metagenome]